MHYDRAQADSFRSFAKVLGSDRRSSSTHLQALIDTEAGNNVTFGGLQKKCLHLSKIKSFEDHLREMLFPVLLFIPSARDSDLFWPF